MLKKNKFLTNIFDSYFKFGGYMKYGYIIIIIFALLVSCKSAEKTVSINNNVNFNEGWVNENKFIATSIGYPNGYAVTKDEIKTSAFNAALALSKVKIENEQYLEIDVKYDSKKIQSKVIKMEITLFLNLIKTPSLLAFDKHSPEPTKNYQIIKKEPCCEICIASAMDRLFEMDGIEKVDSNYNYIDDATSAEQKLILNISYNPNVLRIEDIKKIEETMKS